MNLNFAPKSKVKKTIGFISSFVFLTILLSFSFYVGRFFPLNSIEKFHVLGFDTKASISSEYYLSIPSGPEEIQFLGSGGNTLLLGGVPTNEFLDYLVKSKESEMTKCGVNLMHGENYLWAIIYNNKNFAFFGGDESYKTANLFIEEICVNKENGITWPKRAVPLNTITKDSDLKKQ
jgi:hypothetical protein